MDYIFPKTMEAEQNIKEKLLASGLQPAGFDIPLRNMRAEADLFRPENLPLLGTEGQDGQRVPAHHRRPDGAVGWRRK